MSFNKGDEICWVDWLINKYPLHYPFLFWQSDLFISLQHFYQSYLSLDQSQTLTEATPRSFTKI